MEKETGGHAFPRTGANWMGIENHAMGCDAQTGMTLRDYFAAKAMQGFCALLKEGDNIEALPALAYAMADAMLNERNK